MEIVNRNVGNGYIESKISCGSTTLESGLMDAIEQREFLTMLLGAASEILQYRGDRWASDTCDKIIEDLSNKAS